MTSQTEAIGQLLVIGFEPAEMTPQVRSLLTQVQPAGVILFGRNIQSAQQTHQLLNDCRASVPTRLFCCVDLEGGQVDRFRTAISPSPSAAEVFASGDRKLFRKHGRIIGECCRTMGFNVDFAPVLDLAFEASRKVMSSRAVSEEPKQVVTYAREFLAGLQSAGIIGAGKHFPGLGEAELDTHFELPCVTKPFRKLWGQDLVPYRVMRRELPMVLVGHATYGAVTKDNNPASLSKKWISGVLKKDVGYRGLIASDDMEMGALLKSTTIEEAAVGFIRAGGDLCLICRQEELILRAHEALVKEAERDRRFARRVRESSSRVLAFKKRSSQVKRRTPLPTQAKIARLSRQLWEFGEHVRLVRLQPS